MRATAGMINESVTVTKRDAFPPLDQLTATPNVCKNLEEKNDYENGFAN